MDEHEEDNVTPIDPEAEAELDEIREKAHKVLRDPQVLQEVIDKTKELLERDDMRGLILDSPPFFVRAEQVAISLARLLETARMAQPEAPIACRAVVEFCVRAMQRIANEELAKMHPPR